MIYETLNENLANSLNDLRVLNLVTDIHANTSKEYCLNCRTRAHATSECKARKLKCANCAYNNEKFGLGVNQSHSMIDPKCPYRVWEEWQLKKRIDYGD